MQVIGPFLPLASPGRRDRAYVNVGGSGIALSLSFSSACIIKRFPSSRCASAIQIVRPLESIAERHERLRSRAAYLDLGAHLLDLRCLLFQVCHESFNILLLLCGSYFLLGHG